MNPFTFTKSILPTSTSHNWDQLFCTSLELEIFEGIIPTIDSCYVEGEATIVLSLSTGLGKLQKAFDLSRESHISWQPLSIIKVDIEVSSSGEMEHFFEADLEINLQVKKGSWMMKTYTSKILLDKKPLNYSHLEEADLAFLLAMKS